MTTPTGRIVLLDVDGTLVDYRGELPASAGEAVRAARAAGHHIVLCTGRALAEIYPFLWDLGIDGVIGGNGSYVEADGQVIHKQVLAPDVVDAAVAWLLDEGLGFYLECNAGLFGSDTLPEAIAATMEGGPTPENVALTHQVLPHMIYGEIVGVGPDAAWRTDCNKISFVLRDDVDLDALAARFEPDAAIGTWTLDGKADQFGEFGQVGVHKGVAVARLADHLGVPASEFIAFGDSRSDIELLRAVGTGVAMGQAPDELKALAALVTDPVDADGLAHAFERLGLI